MLSFHKKNTERWPLGVLFMRYQSRIVIVIPL